MKDTQRIINLWKEVVDDTDRILLKIEKVAKEEHEYYDNMPAGFQNSIRGMDAADAASNLDLADKNVTEAQWEFLRALWYNRKRLVCRVLPEDDHKSFKKYILKKEASDE